MPNIWYIKFFDGTEEGSPNRLEFFRTEWMAEVRGREIAERIKAAGGKDKCDIYWEGRYETFYYKSVYDLADKLNELNDIFTT